MSGGGPRPPAGGWRFQLVLLESETLRSCSWTSFAVPGHHTAQTTWSWGAQGLTTVLCYFPFTCQTASPPGCLHGSTLQRCVLIFDTIRENDTFTSNPQAHQENTAPKSIGAQSLLHILCLRAARMSVEQQWTPQGGGISDLRPSVCPGRVPL